VTDGSNSDKTTRRNALKLAGAAALAAAGTAALGTIRTRAAGSGNTVDIFKPPARVANTVGGTKLAVGADMVLGPFPAGGGFSSDSYNGMIGNLTAANWTGAGWLSVRKNGTPFVPASILVNYSGTGQRWSNFFIVRFGDPVVGGMASDGKIIVRCGGNATNFIVDLIGFLGPDQ
jgi:hypothetical protein